MKPLVVLFLVLGCGNPAPSEPAKPDPVKSASGTPAAASPRTSAVLGWWDVPANVPGVDIAGGQLRLSETELVAIKNGKVFVRECPIVVDGDTGRISGCGPTATLAIENGKLVFDAGQHEKFVATRIADATRIAELDALVAKERPPADACDRARACYRAAMAALGENIDEEREFKYVHGAMDCMNTTKALVMFLGEKSKPVPAECK